MERDTKGLAIVIKSEKVRESDSLLWLLTPDRGIIKVYCFGSRKSIKSVKAPLYSEGNFSLYQKGERGQISLKDIDLISTHEGLYDSFDRLTLASLFSELVIKGKATDADIYKLYASSLDALEEYRLDVVASVFILKYLKISGLSGDWRVCPSCGREYNQDETLGFSSLDRVAVCSDCDSTDGIYILPVNARLFCARVLDLDIKECYKLGISDEQIHRIFRYLIRTLGVVFPAALKTIESGLLI